MMVHCVCRFEAIGSSLLDEMCADNMVYADLKPHNVLLTEGGRVKLSDMGLSRQLVAEQSSFESHVAGGSSGWQAPEQLMARNGSNVRQTRSMDVFSLGCVLYHCMTAGKHPFGESFERDAAILRGQPNLAPLSGHPEACNLVSTGWGWCREKLVSCISLRGCSVVFAQSCELKSSQSNALRFLFWVCYAVQELHRLQIP